MNNKTTDCAPVTSPDSGQEICYECEGKRVCWSCNGAGTRRNGEICFQCGGSGRCIVCAGSGQVPHGTAARLDARSGSTTTAKLMLVGNFREMGYGDVADAPSLVDLRGERTSQNKEEVVAYLRNAKSLSFSPGLVPDFFEPLRLIGTHTMRTDGVYVWPDFLASYVETYDIKLPDDFERHMAHRRWRIPVDLDVSRLSVPWR